MARRAAGQRWLVAASPVWASGLGEVVPSVHTRSLIFPTFFWFFQLVLFPGAALGDPEQSSTAAAGAALGWCSPAPPLPAPRGAIAHRLEPEI